MKTIEINGIKVNVLAENIKKYGYEDLMEIEQYPRISTYKRNGTFVREETDDWVVIETEDMKLYMNNMDGYIVIIEFEKAHYDECYQRVVDKEGHIYYTTF